MGTVKSNTILNAEQFVSKRQQELLHVKHAAKLTETRMSKYIHNLKRNSAPPADGITAEHLVHEDDSDIIHVRHIADMLTVCVQFGIVLDNFTNGCDTSIQKHGDLLLYLLRHQKF